MRKRCEEAIPEYEEVLALNPNWSNALHGLSVCKIFTGAIGEAIPLEERAIRISPRDQKINIWSAQIGLVHLLQSRTDEPIFWLKKARNAAPRRPDVPAYLASAYAIKGETELAAAALAEAQRLNPDGLYSSIASVKARYQARAPSVAALYESTFYAGLRKAGMPEE